MFCFGDLKKELEAFYYAFRLGLTVIGHVIFISDDTCVCLPHKLLHKPSDILIKKDRNHYIVKWKIIFVKNINLDKSNTKWEPFVLLYTN